MVKYMYWTLWINCFIVYMCRVELYYVSFSSLACCCFVYLFIRWWIKMNTYVNPFSAWWQAPCGLRTHPPVHSKQNWAFPANLYDVWYPEQVSASGPLAKWLSCNRKKKLNPRTTLNTVVVFVVEYRLAESDVRGQGRLEVQVNGIWGTVCDDLFGDAETRVACSVLGYG